MTRAPANSPLAIPGLAEAIEKEKADRDADFLGVTTTVEGFDLVPMTLNHLCWLRLMKSPFVMGGTPTPVDLNGFLWVMSPEFEPAQHSVRRDLFLQRCQVFLPPTLPWLHTRRAMSRYKYRLEKRLALASKIIESCRQFVHDTFVDAPPRPATVEFRPDYYSSAASFCAVLGREYGWPESEVMQMPIRRILQYNNEIREANNPRAIMFNPSDTVVRDWLVTQNRKN